MYVHVQVRQQIKAVTVNQFLPQWLLRTNKLQNFESAGIWKLAENRYIEAVTYGIHNGEKVNLF
jgi:hypothetical protein